MSADHTTFTVLVTGANSGLGLAICRRLIDEFLHTRASSQSLRLIPTTRSPTKCEFTAITLQKHLQYVARKADKSMPGVASLFEHRVIIQAEVLDLNSLQSVRALARRIRDDKNISSLDALIFNAGIGGWVGVRWGTAFYTMLTDWTQAMTWPTYKIAETGRITRPQLLASGIAEKNEEEPPLGEIFCANVFGHYLLGHELAPLLSRSESGRTIWISSLEAYAHAFDFGSVKRDIQGIHNPLSYEASKRLTDVLALTSRLPSASPWVRRYYQTPRDQEREEQIDIQAPEHPQMYVCQPGICATGIMPLPWILAQFMLLGFYLARLSGSMWHTCTAYSGACSPVWLALASQNMLDNLESEGGVSKWGSAVMRGGDERVERTEVEGWGYGGIAGDARSGKAFKRGRRRGVKELTEDDKTAFEDLGMDCWWEMEKMRLEWKKRLDAAET